ncbi:MAG: hypothetical protein ACMUIE_02470 [Thermoplasmatota archaeon]
MEAHRFSQRSRILNITVALLFLLTAIAVMHPSVEDTSRVSGEPVRASGPFVNKSAGDPDLIFTFFENFPYTLGDRFLQLIDQGSSDVFYDPNNEWGDLPYGTKPFEWSPPWPYNKDTTPLYLTFDNNFGGTYFGMGSIEVRDPDFNSAVYGQDYFKITITANNESGSSASQIWIQLLNVNDAPREISGADFYSIVIPEDGSFFGINKDHDQLIEMMGDPADPYDELTYTVTPNGTTATNIDVVVEKDGSNVTFTPHPDWACDYLPENRRLNGGNNVTYAQFDIRCTDQDGLYVEKKFYVYVNPVNDPPILEPIGEYRVKEDELAHIQFEGHDVDPETEQTLIYGSNLTDVIYRETGIQLEFTEEFDFDDDDGTIEFRTNNRMVGVYEVSAWVDDRPAKDFGAKGDYPTTPYKVYANFTLNIQNVNDGPTAVMDKPLEEFIYNTTWPVTLDASRSTDPDLMHGQELTYRWYKNGELIGEEDIIQHLFDTEGSYNIRLNVSDGEFFDVVTKTITVEKTRIYGEIFDGVDMKRSFTDNATDPLVLISSLDGDSMKFGGKDSVDIRSIQGERAGELYKIKIVFGDQLVFTFSEDVEKVPRLNIYFVKPVFQESTITLTREQIRNYQFPVPFNNEYYRRMEFDLRQVSVTYYPLSDQDKLPFIRKLDTGDGVEITLPIKEMDEMGIQPDFSLYATVELRTQIKEESGQYTIIRSWDATGLNAKVPDVKDIGTGDDDDTGGGGGLLIWIVLIFVILVFMALIAGFFVFIIMRGKAKEPKEQELLVDAVPQTDSIDLMLFDDGRPRMTAEQMYGTPAQQQLPQQQAEGLPPAQAEGHPPQGLPPAQTQSMEAAQQQPPPVQLPQQAQPQAAPPPQGIPPQQQQQVQQQLPAPGQQQ